MDSSTKQQYRWACQRFDISADQIDNLWIDTYVNEIGGCETCGSEYETTHTAYVVLKDGRCCTAEFTDVFSMIREFCDA